VNRELPHLGNAGQGVNRELPHLGDAGKGQLAAYFGSLRDRLKRVRITCGDWKRVVTPSVVRAGCGGDGSRAIFLDPPYATSGDLYPEATAGISAAVRDWCESADPKLKIVVCGYDEEHDALLSRGWTVRQGKAGGGAGYSKNAANGRRERLWCSPACLSAEDDGLFRETPLEAAR
jgi:hypothetical protein